MISTGFDRISANSTYLGLDYYVHSEMSWYWSKEKRRSDIAAVMQNSRGFASIAEDYRVRYGLRIMLSKTNVPGSVRERISWLKYMEAECEDLVLAGHDFRGFCWCPSIDTTEWINGCTRITGQLDPQGIWSLDPERLTRLDTELSYTYGALARGEILSADLPFDNFEPSLQKRLQHYHGIRSRQPGRKLSASYELERARV